MNERSDDPPASPHAARPKIRRAVTTPELTLQPAADAPRPQGLPLPLHLPVLHPLRDRRALPDRLHAVISFQEWDLVEAGRVRRLRRILRILQRPQFWTALRNTFSIFLLSSVPQLILALFIAAMLDRNIRAKTFWRMSVLLPFVMAPSPSP